MLVLDLRGLVHNRVEGGQPYHLGLCPPHHRPEEPWLALRERAVDLTPRPFGAIAPGDLPNTPTELESQTEALYERGLVHLVPLAAQRQQFRALDQEPQEAVSEPVGLLGLVQVPQELLFCYVADS